MAARLVDAQAGGVAARLRCAGALCFQTSVPDRERRVARQLASLYLLTSAWQRINALPEPLQHDLRGLVGIALGKDEVLARLLQGGARPALLREWLRALMAYGGHLPARFLPNLLALGTRHAELRADVLSVLGERGRWLARLDPDWGWAARSEGREDRLQAWETGSIDQRQAALSTWRADDPAAAREALAQVWASEALEVRVRLLGCLTIALGAEDETFLESALDDRRKEVRLAAQAMLAMLPGSQLRHRMRARVEALLQIKRPLLGRPSLDVMLPEAVDKAALREGVGAAAHPGLGEKAGWLADLLSATDPRVWSERLTSTPDQLLVLAARGDFTHALVRGWSSAVARGVAPARELADWIHALLGFWLTTDNATRNQYPREFFSIFGQMAPAALHAWLAAVVGASPRGWGPPEQPLVGLLMKVADQSSISWPAALSREVVERLLREAPAPQAVQWTVRSALDTLSFVVDPPAVAGLEAAWRAGAPDDALHQHIAHFFDTVRLRQTLSLSFQEPA